MINATYFDGQSSRRQPVELLIHKRIVAIIGPEVRRSVRLSKIDVSEPLEHAPRILRLPGGGFVESSDPGLDRLLRKNGYREPRVVAWQRNWPLSLLSLVSLLAVLVAGYQWGLPWAADTVAQHLPASIEKKIGDGEWRVIDNVYMEASRLDEAEQERLRKMFAALRQPRGEKTPYRLEFRYSKVGPNAFALPNGVIVLTDQLVTLAQDDAAVMGVLGHELGHVQRRHSLRRLLQAVGVGMAVNLVIGDVSSALATMPTFLLDQKYSRDFERESDQYAIDMMHANGVPLSPMAHLFEKMADERERAQPADARQSSAQQDDDEDEDEGEGEEEQPDVGRRPHKPAPGTRRADYLSSHPSDAERIARLRAADAKP
ncbi:M48 family metallopeptidase [Noviherbaspirillum autotrophicum]|uniref:M48 family metallopeptidase n=1 Tax=Noviherbaspirillum autotrophicum TaxID=709839 RepID=UPI000693245F|nr:M48 family metallopeptidase [Noviherbaspirillum autotrophicum]